MADLIGTYQFDLNRLTPLAGVTDEASLAKAIIWTLVHQLLGMWGTPPAGAWEHVYSSDGSTHSLTVNKWWSGGVFDPALMPRGTSIVAGTGGGCMALRAPASFPGPTRPVILFCNESSNYAYDWRVFITSGTLSLPTLGSRPISSVPGGASGQWATTDVGGHNWFMTVGGDSVQRRCHLIIAEDGGFFWGASKVGVQRMYNACALFPLTDPHASDQCPWVFYRGGPVGNADPLPNIPSPSISSDRSAWSASHLMTDSSAGNDAQPYTGYGMIAMNAAGTAAVGSVVPSWPWVDPPSYDPSQSAAYRRPLTRYASFDPIRQTYTEVPVWAVDAAGCVRGRLRDLWMTYPYGEGTVDPGGAAPVTRMIWGEFWVPSPDLVVPISW